LCKIGTQSERERQVRSRSLDAVTWFVSGRHTVVVGALLLLGDDVWDVMLIEQVD
jgi:hypothetical protein